MRLFIGNLRFDVSEEDLRGIFGRYGIVEDAVIVLDNGTGESRGFGFVEMPIADQATRAVASLDGAHVLGRTIRVTEATPMRRHREVVKD